MTRTLQHPWVAICLCVCGFAPLGRTQGLAPLNPIPRDDVKTRYAPLETSPVRPLALSPSNHMLFAINQPGARLVVLNPGTLAVEMEIPVGTGLVSLAPLPGTTEVWTVDTAANAVSVIDWVTGQITHTIRVGAEPRAIVFSDSGDRAYVTCAGVHRVDVLATATHSLVNSIDIPAHQPHGVAWLGGKAYVVPMLSGNNTAARGASSGNASKDPMQVRSIADFPDLPSLPDRDLLVILTKPNPAQDSLDIAATRFGLGTILFNLYARPGTTELWIPNTDALNAAHQGATNFVGGQVVKNRVTIVDTSGGHTIVDLDQLAPSASARCSQPTGMAFDPIRPLAYVCGYGTDRIAVLNLSGPTPTWAGHIEVVPLSVDPPTAGPRDCVVDSAGRFLFILNKIDSSISRFDLATLPATPNFIVSTPPPVKLGLDPTPLKIRRGRSHANNARLSGSQTSSCDSCHVDGHLDGLVWELSAYKDPEGTPNDALQYGMDVKGPLSTQSLRALAETAPYHWRGEKDILLDFNAAFTGLLEHQVNGVPTPFPGDQFAYIIFYMQGFHYPSNPRQSLDRKPTAAELAGADVFLNKLVLGNATCVNCHALPIGTSGEIVANLDGTLAPTIDVPQLRGLADRLTPPYWVGRDFGMRTELGAGIGHGGVFASIQDAARREVLGQPGVTKFNVTPAEADQIAAFLSGLDTGLAPSTGFQATAHATNALAVEADELAFLIEQSRRGYCDLIYRRKVPAPGGGLEFESGMFDPQTGLFLRASAASPGLAPHALILDAQGLNLPVTFLGLPLWLGRPTALDRDMDLMLDKDEDLAGTALEYWDTDTDGLPDGYEFLHGTNPLVYNVTSPDTTPPSVLGTPRLIYATETAVKFEFETSEVAYVQISYNGGPIVQRIPFGPPHFDNRFSVVLSTLKPGKTYNIKLDLYDPSENFAPTQVTFVTQPRVFPEPVHVEDIGLSTPQGPPGSPPTLVAQVQLKQGTANAADGYVVEALVFRYSLVGTLKMIDPAATAVVTGGNGVATFSVPATNNFQGPGLAYFVVTDVTAPPGLPPYVRAYSSQIEASIRF